MEANWNANAQELFSDLFGRIMGILLLMFIIFGSYVTVWSFVFDNPTDAYNDAYKLCMWGPDDREVPRFRIVEPPPVEFHAMPLKCADVAERTMRLTMPWPFGKL